MCSFCLRLGASLTERRVDAEVQSEGEEVEKDCSLDTQGSMKEGNECHCDLPNSGIKLSLVDSPHEFMTPRERVY